MQWLTKVTVWTKTWFLDLKVKFCESIKSFILIVRYLVNHRSVTVLILINGMSAIFQQGLKQVLHKHCNFIASSLEVVGCGSNEPVYLGVNDPVVHFAPHWFKLPVMIKSAQNLHSHDETLSPKCVRPFPRPPPRLERLDLPTIKEDNVLS